jgi:hypothetical protein
VSIHKQSIAITIPAALDQKQLTCLIAIFGNDTVLLKNVTRICKGRDGISLDHACILMHYARLLGANTDQFVHQWLDKILMPERSLFTLSTHFFAKKPKVFFELLGHIGGEYPEIFWVSYWSESLWRAHYYVALNQTKQFGEAKKMSNRLPFSFIQRDWKLHSPSALKKAHQQLYEIDFALKNGASEGMLDLFYSKFFSAQ